VVLLWRWGEVWWRGWAVCVRCWVRGGCGALKDCIGRHVGGRVVGAYRYPPPPPFFFFFFFFFNKSYPTDRSIILPTHTPNCISTAIHSKDLRPIEEGCECFTCQRHSRAYLNHLFRCVLLCFCLYGAVSGVLHHPSASACLCVHQRSPTNLLAV
jgi:hypothetical protein